MTEMFKASRWTRGNRLFPTCIEVTNRAVIRHKRSWFGRDQMSISLGKVASVHIQTGIFWSDVRIESTGGSDPLTSHGHTKADARRIRELIEEHQAHLEKLEAKPAAVVPAGGTGVTRGIFVQGCARSGNTLVRELCATGFAGGELLKLSKDQAECSLEFMIEALAEAQPGRRILVGSRNRDVSLAMDLELLRANPEIKVVWMLRHPFDVLTSIHKMNPGKFHVPPERLIASLELYEKFKRERQVLTVRYEEVVFQPEVVQNRIAAAFGLEPIRSFTECYRHFTGVKESVVALHEVRPIDAKSVGRWKHNPAHREYLRGVLKEFPAVASLSRELGYDLELGPD